MLYHVSAGIFPMSYRSNRKLPNQKKKFKVQIILTLGYIHHQTLYILMSSRIGTPRNVTESPNPEDSSNRQSNSLKLQGKQLNQSELKLLHYYNLSHAAAGTPIGKIYSSLFQKEQKFSKYAFPPVLSQKFCLQCGDLFIPGVSVLIKIVDAEDDNKVPCKKLRFSCMACGNEQFDDELIKEKEVVKPIAQDKSKDKPTDKPVNSKAKERTKKRKMNNNLSNLLHEKKKQKEEQTKLNSLNLMEFLK